MTTLDLFNTDFELTDNGLRLTESLHEATGELFSYKNDYIIKKASSLYLNEITVQKEIADTAKAPTLGFESTMIALSQTAPQTTILMRFVESPTWDGRVFFDESKTLLGAILGKKRNNWQTPPNWDGSEQMLSEYNNPAASAPD
ncbi:hypothetical protein [Pseudomonas syringae group genomosp. 3]|uniref:hypothetical protein n=2 Tax=Pseudomonas syringae group genomosp. 3 TaxID=251701 RepID=UPI00070C05F7|nr:hypothetical protein [Pseudomonas syringae group genomosp. 3]RMP64541.1 hypothetical protein ALQ19_01489 [Pseudomonas syringae pv. berberidis]